jgi:hypothetical protein
MSQTSDKAGRCVASPEPGAAAAAGTGKRVAIVQSNYIPWKGYFDLIGRVDEFVLYDDVQYTRRDWRNRNKIKTPAGVQWLSIPVQVKGKYLQKVKDTVVSGDEWRREHWETLTHCYGRAPFFRALADTFRGLYLGSTARFLSEINRAFLAAVCDLLGIRTRLKWSMDYRLSSDDPSERLLEVCAQAQAAEYLSGPAARAYLDEGLFRRAGIRLSYMDYTGYPEYPQLYPPFEHAVSVLDLLFMTGPDAPRYLKSC